MYQNKNTLLLAALLFLGSCQANEAEESALKQRRKIEEKAILTNYLNNEVKKDSILLLSRPYIFKDGGCLDDIIKDLPLKDFTPQEFLIQSAKDTMSWTEGSISQIKILPSKDLPAKNESQKWRTLYDKIGGGFFTFSHILFSKNFEYAIFHTDFNCGDRCGQDRTVMYQKVGKQWILKKSYCVGAY